MLQRAYKVPSLRNVAERAPYMNGGQFATLGQVLDHYSRAPAAPKGHTELKPLGLQRGISSKLERAAPCEWNATSEPDAMTRTVDLVIVGANAAAFAATADAASLGLRVLLVIRPRTREPLPRAPTVAADDQSVVAATRVCLIRR